MEDWVADADLQRLILHNPAASNSLCQLEVGYPEQRTL
jgi:hypothetical protein